MNLSSIFREELIFINEEFNDLESLYKHVGEKIEELIGIDQSIIISSIQERDKIGFPGFENGFAIPHGRVDYNDLIISVVKNKKSITVNNKDYDFFFIIITNVQGSNRYLKLLSTISSIIKNNLKELKSIENKREFIELIRSKDVKISEPVKVLEIMDKSFDIVSIDTTISETLDIMKKHNKDFLPVVDKNGKYLGKIGVIDILKIAYPPYVLSMTSLSFLTDYKAYEEFEKKESTIKVKDIYEKSEKEDTINEDATIIELGFLMVKNNLEQVFVLNKEKKIVGVVDPKTLLDKILRT